MPKGGTLKKPKGGTNRVRQTQNVEKVSQGYIYCKILAVGEKMENEEKGVECSSERRTGKPGEYGCWGKNGK